LAKISEFRERQAQKQKQREARDKQRLEELKKFLQEQATYDLERCCTDNLIQRPINLLRVSHRSICIETFVRYENY